jgi:hypothetical protein
MLKTSPGGQSALSVVEKRLVGSDPNDADVPAPVRKSVKFMLGGALATLVAGLFSIIVTLTDSTAVNSGKPLASSQLTGAVVSVVVFTAVLCSLWVLIARFTRSGHAWARIVATVLFVLDTYELYSGINALHTGEYIDVVNIVSFVLLIAEWICGLGAVALLWRAEAGQYFKNRSTRR